MSAVSASLQRVEPRRAAGAKRRATPRERRRMLTFYAFIAPWLIGFIFLDVIPLLFSLATSLTNYDGLTVTRFLGLGNYVRAFRDTETLYSLQRTFIWALFNIPVYIAASFVLALVLNQDVRGRGVFRTIFYLPTVIPAVVAVWVFKLFLDTNNGLLNAMISLVRPGTAIKWLVTYALPSMTAVAVWSGLGFGMVVFLAGLQNIPTELQEAARIDGANTPQVFRHVTLPLMTPVIFFMLVLSVIGAMQELSRPLLLGSVVSRLSDFRPPRDIYLYALNTFVNIFTYARFGYGSALLWLLILAIFLMAMVLFRTQRYWVHYEVDVEERSP